MDPRKIPGLLSLSEVPVGLGGCRNGTDSFDCCEYNVSVFDGKSCESIHEISGETVKVQHCSLSESSPALLVQLENLAILQDEQWELRMFLARIGEKRAKIMNSFAKSCLVDAGILANRAREASRAKDPLAAAWVKCSAYFLSDAILSLNSRRPSPAHMLDITRRLEKSDTNQTLSLVHQVLGLERASTSLLTRMAKSTIGFSEMVEGAGNSGIIRRKFEYFADHSLLSDCYFYLGYMNRNNMMKIKNRTHKNPEYAHILRVAFDMESDHLVVEGQAGALLDRVNDLLASIKDGN